MEGCFRVIHWEFYLIETNKGDGRMSEETSFESKIFAISMLVFSFCFGYWTRSDSGIALFLQDSEFPIILLDGLVRIIGIVLGILVLIGMILLHFDKKKE